MQSLIRAFSEDREFLSIAMGIESGMREQIVSGLAGSSRQVFLSALAEKLNRPLFVVTHNMFSAQKMTEDLLECLPAEQVLLYPANELMVTEAAVASPETLALRISALTRLANGFRGIAVVPFAGARKLLPPSAVFRDAQFSLRVGDTVELEALLQRMVELGYERVERVESKGEMSVRGGIIDFYPITSEWAYRIELFDVDVDSIRTFDVADQRSIDKLADVVITPCKELIATGKRFQSAAQHAYELLQEQLAKMNDRQVKERLKEEIGHEIEKLRESQYFNGLFKYVGMLFPERHTLLDYIPKDAIIVIDEPSRLLESSKQLERDEAEWMTNLLQEGKSLPGFVMSKSYESILHRTAHPTLYVSLFLRQVPQTQPQNIVNFMCRAMQNFHGQMNVLKSEMERWKKT
ncbi:MAG: mfd, partial [Paenibacillus sp.]|nr:mfd [Paenibacillus sp.]